MISEAPAPRSEVFDALAAVQSPAYLLDVPVLEENLRQLREVAARSGAKIVLAQKAFAVPQFYPLFGQYLQGACASGPWEARLAREHFPPGAEILTCAPAYSEADIASLLPLSNHLDFNSAAQWVRHRETCLAYQKTAPHPLLFGLRINPECSTSEVALYDPCAAGSRLGMTSAQMAQAIEEDETFLDGISGLHFHTLCEQGYEDLEATMVAVLERFGPLLERPSFTYLNLGGGHWITKPDYNTEALIKLASFLQERYKLQLYLEPGEAVVIHSGVLVGTILDLIPASGPEEASNVIFDLSATAHMPDVLEMPYRPTVYRATGERGGDDGAHLYQFGGNTCLAGDQIGEYTFCEPLQLGEKIIFNDMAHYTMVKSTFFNGVRHPAIYSLDSGGGLRTLKQFNYDDYFALKE